MKKITFIIFCIILSIKCFAHEPDTLSLKDHIFYHFDHSEFTEVVQCCNEALEVYQSTNDLFEMAGCYNLLGIAYQRLGRFKEAIESYDLCAQTMEKLRDSEYALHQEGAAAFYDKNIRYTCNNMATIYWEMNEYDEAERLYRKCIEMLGEPHDTIDYLDLASYCQNLSEVSLKQAASLEDPEKAQLLKTAVDLAEQALQLSEQYGDLPFKHIVKKVVLAQAYHAAGRTHEAIPIVNEAMVMAIDEGDAYLQAEIHAVYGDFEAYERHYEAAERHYSEAASIATANHFDELQRSALDGAYDAARHFDKALALDYFEQSTALKDSVFNAEQQQLVRDYQVKYDLAEKDHQIALEEAKNKANRHYISLLLILSLLLLGLLIMGMRMGHLRKQQNKALANLNKTRNHMFSVVSHDLKTSVMSQNLMLDVMESHFDEMTKDDVHAKVLTLKASSDGLKEKMLNLIEWMKIGLQNSKNPTTSFNLHALVKDCIESQKTEIEKKRLTVTNGVKPSQMANDDANTIQLVLRNLISNAVKFSWPDSKIQIEATEDNGKLWISINDHGMGISTERKEYLLKDMVVPSQGTQGETGSGIGLMLCKQLIDRNGGEIIVESQVGIGTTVKFSINPL
jgi:signal transduction histidine kinase